MPPGPLAVNAITGTHDQAGASGTRDPAPVAPGRGPRKARALLPGLARTALPAAARWGRRDSARAGNRGDPLQQIAGPVRRARKTGGSDYDPLFEQPDLIEDDYYRFRNQPRGSW
jgi:hypothetical protein